MWGRRGLGRALGASGIALSTAGWPTRWATGPTPFDQTQSLVWVLIGISVAGALVTFGFLVYALWKFRDARVRGRRYG